MIEYKINVLEELKANGYSSARLRKEKLLSESTIQALRESRLVSYRNISRLCILLNRDIGDILQHVPGEEKAEWKTKQN